ncbi:MAG: heavy-metal-associated domain-containing protein [Oscillospiraceae bacterium]
MSKASACFTLGRLDDKHDAKKIKRELDALPGVLSVSIRSHSGCVAVDFDTTGVQPESIRNRIEKLGYPVLDSGTEEHIM